MPIAPWRATCLQINCDSIAAAPDRDAAWPIITQNIDRAIAAIDTVCAEKDPPKLVLLPEYLFQGVPQDGNVPAWIDKACCPIPGPISQRLQEAAERHGIYVGAHQLDSDPDWPGRYFSTCFLIDPRGKVILRYRRINTAMYISPHDLMDAYVAHYGAEGTFPVVSTELGRLAMIPCGELAVPEVARVFMMRGAEVIIHPTNEQMNVAQEAAKVARSAENMVYLISTNNAGPISTSADGSVLGGRSQIVDFRGKRLAYEESAEESLKVSAMIDIEALRTARRSPGMGNTVLRGRFEMYRPFYAEAAFYPPNSFLDHPMKDAAELSRPVEIAQRNLRKAGIVSGEDGSGS